MAVVCEELSGHIQALLPGARIEATVLPSLPALPMAAALELYLLNADYPQAGLSRESQAALMDNPLYWIFCWASGQVLSRFLLAHPEWVQGKRVLDFGCGSGVVAIAAAKAGAREVIACDTDPLALAASRRNAELNEVSLLLCDDFNAIEGPIDLILVADVLYDRANFAWLARFVERAEQVLVADSRVKDFDFPPYTQLGRYDASTLPDLDESREFRDVRIFQA